MKMKNQYSIASRAFANMRLRILPCALAACAILPELVHAGIFVKTNSTANLNTAAAWTNNAVPGVNDIAQWDSTAATTTTNSLGANSWWSGIRILNPGAPVQINTGNTLTNGLSGIDMSAASQSLILSNTIFIAPGGHQFWNVAPGQTLYCSTLPIKAGYSTANPPTDTGIATFSTTGTIILSNVTASIFYDTLPITQNNPWATYGLSDWAALSSGQVIAASYSEASAGFVQNVNFDVDTSITIGTGSTFEQSLRFNSPTPVTLTIPSGATFTPRGILVTPSSGGGLITNVNGSGFVRVNRGSGNINPTAFHIIQNSSSDFTIGAQISSISSGTSTAGIRVVKSGQGNLILSAVNNSYVNGTYVNEGTLTVAPGASLGSAAAVINNGKLVINATPSTFVSGITVNTGGTNTINVNNANAQQSSLLVTFNTGSTRLQFNYKGGVPMSTTTAPLLVSNLVTAGTISVDILSGSPATGIFPLVKYTNSLSGSGFSALNLAVMPLRTSGYLSNDTANTSIDLVITNVNEPIKWAVGNGNWDIGSTASWKDSLGASTTYQEANGFGDSVVFDDTASGVSPLSVTLNANTVPGAVTVNATKNYSITGSGSIGGQAVVTKSGSGTLVLGTANSFAGGLNLNGGILNFNALTNLGGGAITFGGGTLQYNGNSDDISTHTVTLGTGGGTIDTAGQTVTYNGPIGNNGAGGLTKTGNGTLTLSGTNHYAGYTIINQGTLALNGNSYISNNAAIVVNSGTVLDTASSGVGLTLDGGQILAGSGTVNGEITLPAGATVSPGTNGVFSTLTFGNDLTFSGGTYACDVSSSSSDLLVVNGNLTLNSGTILTISAGTLPNGVYKIIQYTGSLLSGAGSSANLVITGFSQAGKVATLSDANPGEIDLVIVTQGGAVKVWQGDGGNNFWDVETTSDWTNSAGAAAQFVQGDVTIFNDSTPNTSVNLQAAVQPASVTVNGTQSYTFLTSGTGRISGSGSLTNNSTGTLTISTSDNSSGQTVINAGTVQVGNGGAGDIGSGNVINNSALVFDQSIGTLHTVEQISGPGTVTQEGSDTVAFDQNNTFSGGTLISGGTLQVGANAGATGSLGTGPVTNNSVLVINRSGTYALNNAISGSGSIGFAGSGTVTLGGANSYLNNTYITNGTVKLSASEVIPDANSVPGSTGWLVLDGGATAGTFDLNGFNETINSLSGLAGTVNGLITNSMASSTATNTLTVLENAATTYSGLIADNANSSKVRLVVLGNTELQLAGNNTYSGGTQVGVGSIVGLKAGGAIGVGTITLSNTATLNLHTSGSSSAFANNLIYIPDNSAGQFNSSSQGNGVSGSIVGGPTATNTIIGLVSASAANLQQYNGFFGTVVVNASEALRFSASSGLNNGGTNTIFDVEGNLFARNGGTITLGALEGAGSIGAPSTLGTATYVIGSKNLNTVFSGTINNALPSTNNAVTKTGTGKLTLSGTLSYLGNTTVENGTLALVDPAMLDNSPTITLSSNTAAIDVTGRSDTSLNLGNISPQVLAGHGNIYGSLNEAASTTNNLTLGTLSVSGTATISGALNLQINRTNTPNCSQLAASTFVNSGSIVLIVSNVGPTNLVAGDKFQLFSKAFPGTFVTTNLPALPSSQLYWTNYIPVNGSLVVASLVNTTPTNITFSVTGNTLSLSWPADHLGWYLQAQTNSVGAGLGSNWVDVAGSSSVTSETFTINPANPTVFYRMSLTP